MFVLEFCKQGAVDGVQERRNGLIQLHYCLRDVNERVNWRGKQELHLLMAFGPPKLLSFLSVGGW